VITKLDVTKQPSAPTKPIMPERGSIYTPSAFADFLVAWAIRSPEEMVLDLGVGVGSFVFSAHNRLVELGADTTSAQTQLHGAEIDKEAFNEFNKKARESGMIFPNIHHADFFNLDFPQMDVIVGNPPYVRRMNLPSIDDIRKKVVQRNSEIKEKQLSRLTDLYVYFLLYALPKLKPGGRLAVITADPWLNVGYGEIFKKYLLNEFYIDSFISLDRRVFGDAQVKPVMILARKKDTTNRIKYVRFIRVKNGLPIKKVGNYIEVQSEQSHGYQDIAIRRIDVDDLKSEHPWGTHFKLPHIFDMLVKHPYMIPISSVAQTRIGLQTLAKDFFVLTPDQVRETQIERRFLRSLAQSPRYSNQPVILPNAKPDYFVFYCSEGKDSLENTFALKYISDAENKVVNIRGKQATVIGYQNKQRIKDANRPYWYNLATDLKRRGIAEILIPRLIYRSYNVVWNQASFIPGELFIEFLPLPLHPISKEVYLAILTSSVTEIMLRAYAQVYGGGTYNVNPGQVKKIPILAAHLLAVPQRESLKQAYRDYLESESHDRSAIDKAVFEILGLSDNAQEQIDELVNDLITIATSTKMNQLDA
jgi:hypothetical protein